MKQKTKSLISLKATSAFLSLLFFVILAGGMAIDVPNASAGIPTFTAARTALNTIELTFNENVTGTAIADSFTVAGATSVTNTAPTASTSVTLTTVGLTATDGTPNVGYVAATGDILSVSTSQEIADGGAIAAADQVAPTFTAVRTALNTIVLTLSETVTGTAIADSFTVVGASSVTNTAPTASTSVTLTTVGLTATDGTPNVGYVAATGDIVDNSAATNEIADGGAIAAADQVAPTFTAVRTALNTIVLTLSETVTGTAIADSFTVVGASSVTNTAPTASTSVTLTTVGLTATDGTPNVGYVAATGDIVDNSAATNEIADGGAIAAADQVAPTAAITYSDSNVTSGKSLTITATFSEAMANSPVVKISLSGANTVSATVMTKVTTTSYTYTYTVASGSGTVTVALSIGTDVATNVITSAPTSGATFTTANAGGGFISPIPTSTTGQAAATPAHGGVISKTNTDGTSVKVVLPAGALIANAVITISPTAKAEAVLSRPIPVGNSIVGDYAYNFTAVSGLNIAVNAFEKALTLTFIYTNEQVEGIDEGALKIYYWDDALNEWVALADSEVDTVNNAVIATTTHFTYFAVFEGESSEIMDGDIIQCQNSDNPFAVYIVKVVGDTKYIRHIVSLEIFNYYTHLKWENLKQVDFLDNYSLSGWARVNTGPNGTPGSTDKVYEINSDQSKHWINMTAEEFLTHGGSDAAIYSVNQGEMNLYTTGPDVMSL